MYIFDAAMEQFVWLEDYHLMREDWNTVTMEHAWTQLCYSNFHNEEAIAACRQLGYTNLSKNLTMVYPDGTNIYFTIHLVLQKQLLLQTDHLDKNQTLV